MAIRGRKPLPDNVRQLHGNPGHRPMNPAPPRYTKGETLRCPARLTDAAKRHWRRVVPQLVDSGTVVKIDIDICAHYCELLARYEEAQDELVQSGMLVRTPNGHIVQSPLLPIVNKTLQHIHRLQMELGMTPSSRSRVTASGNVRDDVEEFLFGGDD